MNPGRFAISMIQSLSLIILLNIFSPASAQDTLIGDLSTQLNSQCVQINPAVKNTSGWSYGLSKFSLNQRSTMRFSVFLGDKNNGSGGMVFILHNDPRGMFAEGCTGEGLGYGSNSKGPTCPECGNGTRSKIMPSIGIEFDTETNSNLGDPAQQHIAYLENGNVNHGKSYVAVPKLTDNKEHIFEFTWDPVSDSLIVYFDGQKKIAIKKDIQNLIFNGASSAYWGFAGCTGNTGNKQYFCKQNSSIAFFNDGTKTSGNFDSPQTWISGSIPATSEKVIVLPGHSVILRKNEGIGGVAITNTSSLNLNGYELAVNNYDVDNKGKLNGQNGSLRFNGTSSQNIYTRDTITIKDLKSYNSAGTALRSGHIRLTGTLLISAGTFSTGDNLTLVSTASQTGRIAEIPSGASVSGKVTVQRYIAAGLSYYRYLTSPVQNAYVSDWQNEIPVTGTFTDPSSGRGIIPTAKSLYYYDETSSGDLNSGWVNYPQSGSSAAAPLVPGKGYSIFVRDFASRPYVDVTGYPNTGNQNVTLTYTTSAGSANDGWNLIGNPYPSQINWDLVASGFPKGVGKAVYFTDNDEPGGTLIRSYVNGIGVPASTTSIISSSQAFWVKAIQSGTYTITFRESHKAGTNANFYRTAGPNEVLRIRLINSQSQWDETVIARADSSTSGFDLDFDALKMKNNLLNISSLSKDSLHLSINSVSALNGPDTIALNTGALTSGKYFLNFSGLESFLNSELFLLDNNTGEKTAISPGYVHPFEVSSTANNDSLRFSVILRTSAATQVFKADKSSVAMEVYPNPVEGSGILNFRSASLNGDDMTVTLSDLAGRNVFTTQVSGAQTNGDGSAQVQLPVLEKGIYSLTISTGNQELHKNLVVR